jgi:hypothetical protein
MNRFGSDGRFILPLDPTDTLTRNEYIVRFFRFPLLQALRRPRYTAAEAEEDGAMDDEPYDLDL